MLVSTFKNAFVMPEDNQGVTLNWMVCKIQSHPVVCGEQAGCLVLKHNPDVVHEWPSCTAINLCFDLKPRLYASSSAKSQVLRVKIIGWEILYGSGA